MDSGFALSQLVERFGGKVLGDAGFRVRQVASLEQAQSCHISFLTSRRFLKKLDQSAAGAVILGIQDSEATMRPRIVCDNPYAYFAKVSALLNPVAVPQPGIHPSAVVHPSARVSPTASVGPFVHIGAGCEIADGVVIDAGSVVGQGVHIGAHCHLYPRVVIYHDCVLGERVILHAGVVIGADGFGLALEQGRWLKIPQIGRVLIGNDVEIGANTTVDRGALEDTVIEDGVKLDNQIQVAHNVRIGAHSAMAGCVGIAGSAKIGRHCTVGGAGMILGHLEIADHVQISSGTLITKSISKPGTYTSTMPFSTHEQWLKNAAHLRHLDALSERVRHLEQQLDQKGISHE